MVIIVYITDSIPLLNSISEPQPLVIGLAGVMELLLARKLADTPMDTTADTPIVTMPYIITQHTHTTNDVFHYNLEWLIICMYSYIIN